MPPEIKTYSGALREHRHEYGHIHTFVFERPDDFDFAMGNYVHIRILSVPLPHKAVRDISIASAPSDTEIVISTTVESNSPWKQELLKLVPGDRVEFFKVKSYLTAPDEGTLIMIAGGIGITPFRSVIRQHTLSKLSFTPILVHIARDNYLYEDELASLSLEQYRITREESEATLNKLREKNPNALYMVAGSPSFVDGIAETLKAKGISETMIQTDSFDGLK